MNKSKKSHDELEELRQHAERKLQTETLPLEQMSEEDVAATVHELRCHQIELEMQNEQLRQAQDELEESRTKYADLFDYAPVGYLVVDAAGLVLEMNLTAASMLGNERGLLVGKPLGLFLTPASRDAWRFHYGAVFKTGKEQQTNLELLPRDEQSPLVVQLRSRPVRNGGGQVVQCHTVMTNITALARAEQRLRESERRFRTLAENAPDVITRIGRDMRILYVNQPIERALGIPPAEFVGRTFEELGVSEEMCTLWTEAIRKVFRTQKANQTDFDCSSPEGVRHYTATAVPEFGEDDAVETVLVTVRDITGRVRAEERYTNVIRSLQDGFCIIDAEGHYLEVNDTYCRMLGRICEELLQLTVLDVWAPHEQPEVMLHLQEALRDGSDKFYMRHRRKDGSRLDCDVTMQKLDGDRLFVFARDVTEQRIVQEQIAFQAQILADVGDAVIATDNEERVTYWNEAAARIYGVPQEEAFGAHLTDLYQYRWPTPEEERAAHEALEQTGEWHGTNIHIKRSGAQMIAQSSISVLKDEQGNPVGLLNVSRDITQRHKAEQERMEALQRFDMVARATHDGLWDWDITADTCWHNAAFAEAFGYHPDEVVGPNQWWRQRVHPDDAQMVGASLAEMAAGQDDTWSARYRFRRKDGAYAWVMDRGHVVRDERGNAVRMVGSTIDLTEKLELLDQLESERTKLATILDTALSGIVVADEQARITYANPIVKDLYGQIPIGEEIESRRQLGMCYPDGTPYEPRDMPLVRSALDGVALTGVEVLIQRSDGETRHVLLNTNALRDGQGKVMGAVGVFHDITELRRAEQIVREARDSLEQRVQERTAELDSTVLTLQEEVAEKIEAQNLLMRQNDILQTIVNNIPVMLCFYDAEGNIGMTNDEFTRALGYSSEDFTARNALELCFPDERYRREALALLLSGEPGWRDFLLRHKDGGQVVSSWAHVRLTNGSYLGIGIDIRERKRFENRLRESEERYRMLVELSPDAIGVELDGILQFVNSTAVKLLGAKTAGDIIGRPIFDFVHPDHRKLVERQFKLLRRKRQPLSMMEERIVRLDGGTVDVELAASPVAFENRPANQVVLRDITQRKQVEDRLRRSAQQLQQQAELLDLAHDSIVVNDMEGRIVFWNRGAEQTYGWTRDEVVGKIGHELLKTRFPLNLIEITAKLLSQGRWNGELTHTTRSGRTIIVSSRWALQRDDEGRPTGILVIDRDISQQKRAELETLEARRFAESITNTVQESLLVLDRDLKVVSANQTFYRTFQVAPEETEGRYIYEIGNHQWDIPALRTLLEDILPHDSSFEDFEVEQDFERIGHRTTLLNGRRIYRETQETEQILLAIMDTTLRKEQDRKIQEHQQQLAALTEELLLTEERERHRLAVVLHDSIGQSLAFSKRELGVVQRNTPPSVKDAIEYVKKQIDDAIRQTRSLTFELSPTTLHTFGLEAAVEELTEQFTEREGLRCHFETTEEGKPLTEQVKTLLYRAARELLTNAAKHAEASDVFVRIDRVDNSIRMVVEDNGKGFDVARIGETIEQREGFGLLSIRERLTHIGGTFAVQSESGQGTKVTLTAPLHPTSQGRSRSKKS